MNRMIYISGNTLSLVEYMACDDIASYENWQDPETKSGYNYVLEETFEKYAARERKNRFHASIMLNKTEEIIGSIALSPETGPPDLAIWIHKQFRRRGYGPKAFSLGIAYCFKTLGLEKIYAGCYPHNQASMAMLQKCGFTPHPSGNVNEKHYLTGAALVQHDFVLYNPLKSSLTAKIISGIAEKKSLARICLESGVEKRRFFQKVYTLIDDGQIPNVLLCYCGHDCSRCQTFHATLNDDNKMRESAASFYMSAFNQVIPLEKLHCLSGRSDEMMEGCRQCPFMNCATEKGIGACEECGEYPCPMLGAYMDAYVNKVNQRTVP